MATVNPVHEWIAKGVLRTTWSNLASGDVGGALDAAYLSDKTVTVIGTFNTATCILQGSNDTTATVGNWFSLADPNGNTLALSSGENAEAILESPRYIRPNVGNGGGSTSVTVQIVSSARLR